MEIYEIRQRKIRQPFGSGNGFTIENYLVAQIWDSMNGVFRDSYYNDDIIINDKKHLDNFVKKNQCEVTGEFLNSIEKEISCN